MGAALHLDYTYRYAHPSELTRVGPELGLRLATFGGAGAEPGEHPFFFDGRMRQPHVAASMLLTRNASNAIFAAMRAASVTLKPLALS